MAMNLTDSGSNMHSEEQQNPEQVAKFNINGQKMLFSGHL